MRLHDRVGDSKLACEDYEEEQCNNEDIATYEEWMRLCRTRVPH
jgi:hypothetical protein